MATKDSVRRFDKDGQPVIGRKYKETGSAPAATSVQSRAFNNDGQPITPSKRAAAPAAGPAQAGPAPLEGTRPSAASSSAMSASKMTFDANGQPRPAKSVAAAAGIATTAITMSAIPGMDKKTFIQADNVQELRAACMAVGMPGKHYLQVRSAWELERERLNGAPLVAFTPAPGACVVETMSSINTQTVMDSSGAHRSITISQGRTTVTNVGGDLTATASPYQTFYDMNGNFIDDKYLAPSGVMETPDQHLPAASMSAGLRPQPRSV